MQFSGSSLNYKMHLIATSVPSIVLNTNWAWSSLINKEVQGGAIGLCTHIHAFHTKLKFRHLSIKDLSPGELLSENTSTYLHLSTASYPKHFICSLEFKSSSLLPDLAQAEFCSFNCWKSSSNCRILSLENFSVDLLLHAMSLAPL